MQHEIVPRVSVNAGYFRRWYGNLRVDRQPEPHAERLQSRTRSPRRSTRGCRAAAAMRSPGLFDANRLVAQNNIIDLASHYGTATEVLQRRRLHGERAAAARHRASRADRASAASRRTTASPSTRRRAPALPPAQGAHERRRAAVLRREAAVSAEREAARRLSVAVGRRAARGDVPEPAWSADHGERGPTRTRKSSRRSDGISRPAPPARRRCN